MLITQDAAEAEEAAQDAFVKAWRALARFRAGEPLRPWLLTIVANEARNRRRSAGRRTRAGAARAEPDRVEDGSAEAHGARGASRAPRCSARWRGCATTTGSCSAAATCSSSPRPRPRPRSASSRAPSSRAPRARSRACARR